MNDKNEKKPQLLGKLAERMRQNKRFEVFVYVALIGMAALLYVCSTGGESINLGGAGTTSETGTEKRLERVLSEINGAGDVRVMITYETVEDGSERVAGVIVVAEGAANMSVKMDLIYAVRAVLGIEQNRIEIFEMG